MVDLYDYQRRAVKDVLLARQGGARRVCLVMPTAAGKSVVSAEVVRRAREAGHRVLAVAHRRELVEQLCGHYGPEAAPVCAGMEGDASKPIQVASIQTLMARDVPIECGLVVTDECFPAGTKMGDRWASKSIENVRVGDLVPSFDEATMTIVAGKVVGVIRSRPAKMCRIHYGTESIECTEGHPFLTRSGWIPATLTCGQMVRYITSHENSSVLGVREGEGLERQATMRVLRTEGSGEQEESFATATEDSAVSDVWPTGSCVRQARMEEGVAAMPRDMRTGVSSQAFIGDDDKDQQAACLCQNEGQQPDASARDTGKGGSVASCNRSLSSDPRREWEATADSTGASCCGTSVANRSDNRDGDEARERLPDDLQGGHRAPGRDDCDRGGRIEPLRTESQGAGQEEGIVPGWIRVDSVEVLEPGSDGRFAGLCPDGYVYNLEVEGTHTYIANGFVVHNCHHLPQGGQWVHVVQSYGDVRWLGLTATPERADGQPLGDTFDHLVVGAQYSELLECRRIVPCDVFFPPETLQKGIALSVAEAYRRYANGGQAFVFVNSVDEAFKVTVELQNAGVLAAAVTGDSDSEERAESFMLFRRGYVKAIVNVFVCTEGIDVPSASVCILARGVGHASTYLQMVGRVLRTAPGKECARLIDLTGSVLAHGLPTSDREYSLTGTAIGVTKGGRSLRVCLQCGLTWESAGKPGCPRCGFVPTPKNKEPRIYDVELQAVYAGAETGSDAMAKELARLRGVARARGYSVGWVVKQYRDLFGCSPPGYVFAEDERRREWSRLVGITRDRGYKKGYAFARFKATFGSMPGWGW